jgi:vacuolar-type H+-ATPase subunit I/STV1
MKEKLCVHVPFSVYLGWITVATIANITAYLISIQWDGFGIDQLTWTIIIIAVGTLLTYLMLALRKDLAFSLVVLWAFFGIWLKRMAQPNTITDINVATTVSIAIVLIVAGLLSVIGYDLMRKNKQKPVQEA